MKIKMMIVSFAIAIAMVTQVSAQCGPCEAANPCNSCNTCCSKPCDLFSGLKNLLQCRPAVVACSPCDPVVACGPSACDTGPAACDPAPSACDPCVGNACDPCNVNACDPCGNGFKFGGFGLFNRINCGPAACDPGACGPGACDPGCGIADPGACDPSCGPTACGACGWNDCSCPGPVATFLIKSRVGAKKLFKNLFGSLDCGPCGPASCGACDPCGNLCGPKACEVAAPTACGCCQ